MNNEYNMLSDEELKAIDEKIVSVENDENREESGAAAGAVPVFLAAAGWPSKSY